MADPLILAVRLGAAVFNFYDFVGTRTATEFERKIEVLRPFFNRIPSTHLNAISGAKIFVVQNNPNHASPGGAYYRPSEVHRWLGQRAVTGVEDIWLGPQLLDRPPRQQAPKHLHGLLSVCEDKFSRGVNVYKYTFLHELAHMIDFAMGFTHNARRYGLSLETLRGVRYGKLLPDGRYRHSTSVGEYFAEAYSRWIINGNAICRDQSTDPRTGGVLPSTIPHGENQSVCSARLRGVLERL